MAKTKLRSTPVNIDRYTLQMDKELYKAIRRAAMNKECKTYELMNKILLLGCEAWSKTQKESESKINIRDSKLESARKMAKAVA